MISPIWEMLEQCCYDSVLLNPLIPWDCIEKNSDQALKGTDIRDEGGMCDETKLWQGPCKVVMNMP